MENIISSEKVKPKKHKELTLEEYYELRASKFWERVDKPKGAKGCWFYRGTTTKDGFGQFRLSYGGKAWLVSAHRFAYMTRHGWDIPANVAIKHTCGTAGCCNPDHLYAEIITHVMD